MIEIRLIVKANSRKARNIYRVADTVMNVIHRSGYVVVSHEVRPLDFN